MWSKIKALPVLPKILIGCVILVVIAKAAQHQRPQPLSTYRQDDASSYSQPVAQDRPARGDEQPEDRSTGQYSDQRQQMLASFQSQQAQLQMRARDCMAQMNQATQQQAVAAMNGQMYNARPACEQQMPQMIAQEAYFETEIYKLQTGDTSATVRGVSHIPEPTYGGSPYSSPYSRPSSSGSGTDQVENWDRQAIRGNSLYTDETGEQRELPSHSYYFRDRASGELIGSERPDPPNNGRDYEVIQPQPQQ